MTLKNSLFWLITLALLTALFIVFKPGLASVQQEDEALFLEESTFEGLETYQEILATGVVPQVPPDYEFPASFQYLNGCFGFSVGHILMDRGWEFDMLEMEERIQKPREVLWNNEWRETLAEAYDLELESYKSPELLFQLLEDGETFVLRYEYPLEGDEWILHAVAAYSFDQDGIWVSDSLSGGTKVIPYEKVFTEKGDETRYTFTRVIEK